MRRVLGILAALLLLAGGAAAQEEAAPLEVSLLPVFVLGTEGPVDYDPQSPPRPGDTLGLAIEWPEDRRPAAPRLAERTSQEGPLPRRLVVRDPRAGGRDVVEVLLSTLEGAELAPLVLVDEQGAELARTRAIFLVVQAALPPGDAEHAPARPPAGIGLDWWAVSALLLGALALLGGLAWLVRRYWPGARDDAAPDVPDAPQVPPEVRALDALEALLAEGLLERRLHKPFCVRLAEIGKGYLGEISGVPLLERTSSECLRELRAAGAAGERIAWIMRWLELLDLVKFAEERPAAQALLRAAEELRELVVRTSAERERAALDAPATDAEEARA